MPIIGFIIGYFTNYLAIKMLFHPRNKVLGIQGVLPKRRKLLAKKISEATVHIMPSKLKEIEKIPWLGPKIINYFKTEVEKEINSMNNGELEQIILKVVKKELRFITWIGGVIGLIIGLVQALILLI